MRERIESAAIVGMGALGMLYGGIIRETLGPGGVCFIMDKDRLDRYRNEECLINGKKTDFRLCGIEEARPADLVIAATKSTGLKEALPALRAATGPETTVISVLNGITSEEIIAEVIPRDQIVDCVSLGMDAVREGRTLTYHSTGKLQIPRKDAEKQAAIQAERRRLERMEDLLRNAVQTTRAACQVRPGEIVLEEHPAAQLAVVRAPAFTAFEESTYLLHIRDLLQWAREHGSAFLAPGDIIRRESLERDRFLEDAYFCQVPEGTRGWEMEVRPAGLYAVLCHRGSYRSEPEACRRLRDWVLEQGYAVDGDLYEEDLVSYATSPDPEAYLLRLSLKIRKDP